MLRLPLVVKCNRAGGAHLTGWLKKILYTMYGGKLWPPNLRDAREWSIWARGRAAAPEAQPGIVRRVPKKLCLAGRYLLQHVDRHALLSFADGRFKKLKHPNIAVRPAALDGADRQQTGRASPEASLDEKGRRQCSLLQLLELLLLVVFFFIVHEALVRGNEVEETMRCN